jgi:hypothetical protein
MAYEVLAPDLKQVVFDILTGGMLGISPDDAAKLKIGVNDPLDWADFPFCGINLLADTEQFAHIGDSLADEFLEDEGQIYAGISALFQQHVEIKLWSINGDERDRLGTLLKVALMTGRGTDVNPGLFLTTPGLANAKITGGMDEGISVTGSEYPAHTVYTRTYYVTALTEVTLQEKVGEPVSDVLLTADFFAADIDLP